MLRKIWVIFSRDIMVNLRDGMTLYLMVIPFIFALLIRFLVPSVNDTTVNLAMLDGDNPEQVAYFEQFANVVLFADEAAIERRLMQRDNMVAILPDGDDYYVLSQGDEPDSVIEIAQLYSAYYELGVQVDETTANINTFGRTEPPLKKMLVNVTMMFISVLGGMLIAINIVEEKQDNTVSAINVSPISRVGFILGKSVIGMGLSIYGVIAVLLITGYGSVNIGQMVLAIGAVTLLSVMVGFLQGLNSEDMMDAAGSAKMLFFPLAISVAVAELLGDKWQPAAYWIPYYWTYKGNDAILSYSASWTQILSYTGIVLVICAVVYVLVSPRIQKGLAATH